MHEFMRPIRRSIWLEPGEASDRTNLLARDELKQWFQGRLEIVSPCGTPVMTV